tara:strand:+ start:4479 stop:5684 length:1206 start_codon:yes stop_codon:yes gene_type:complete
MCGLVGVIGDINFQDAKVFQQLLFVDTLRGSHSTGVATNNTDNEVQVYKRALSAPDFLQLKQGGTISSSIQGDFLMGHNRYATQGQVNDANAHPFTYGNITLAHNGTLIDQTTLPDHKDFPVDSENIAYAMGQTSNPEEVISILKGAFALTWYNDHMMEFYIVRNDERPMWIAKHKTRNVYYYASEMYMLEAILTRNDVSYELKELPAGTVATFNLEEVGKLFTSYHEVKLAPKVPKKIINWNQGYNYSNTPNKTVAPPTKWQNDVKNTSGHPLNKLKDFCLSVGDEVEFYSDGIPDEPKESKGKMKQLLGITTDGFHLETKCFNAPAKAIAGYYTGILQSMIKNGDEYTLVLHTPWLTEVIENDANNVGKEKRVAMLVKSDKVLVTEQEFDEQQPLEQVQ